MTTTTVGAFKDHVSAEKAIVSLRDAGIADTDISCLYSTNEGEVHDSQTDEKVGAGAVTGATLGAAVGAIAGLAVANGILPGLGTLFVAGPLATALGLTGAAATTAAGAATGLAAGGLIGALTGLGISDEDAEYFQNMLHKGSHLVVVASASNTVKKLLQGYGATEVREYHVA